MYLTHARTLTRTCTTLTQSLSLKQYKQLRQYLTVLVTPVKEQPNKKRRRAFRDARQVETYELPWKPDCV